MSKARVKERSSSRRSAGPGKKAAVRGAPSRDRKAQATCFCEKLSSPYVGLDAAGAIVGANRAFLDMLGYGRGEVIGCTLRRFLTPGSAAVIDRKLPSLLRIDGCQDCECDMVRKDGGRLTVVLDATIERDRSGRFKRMHILLRDITGQRLAEEALFRSEQRYFTLFEHSPMPTWEVDYSGVKAVLDGVRDGGVADVGAYLQERPDTLRRCLAAIRIMNANRSSLEFLRANGVTAIPADLGGFFVESSWPVFRALLVALLRGATEYSGEMPMELSGENGRRSVLFRLSLAPGFEATWSRVFFSFIDVTEQRALQQQLLNAKQFAEDAINTLPDIFFAYNLDGGFLMWNRRAREVTGYNDQEIAQMQPVQFFAAEDAPRVTDAIARVIQEGVSSIEADLLTREGARIPYEFTGGALRDHSGRNIGVVGAGRNMAERQRHLRALEQYARIVSATPDHISLVDRNYVYRLVNDAYLQAHGKRREEILGHSVSDLLGATIFSRLIREKLDRCLSGETVSYESWVDFPAQGRRSMSVTYHPYREADGSISGAVVSSRDVTDLRQAEKFVTDVLQSVDEGFIVIDRDFRIVSANKAYCDQVQEPLDSIVGKHCYEVSHRISRPCHENGEACAVRHSFRAGEPATAMHIHPSADGGSHYTELKSFPLRDAFGQVTRVIEVLHDVTERRKLEDQLRHAQKMEAIGTLAGGIAHDFNNFLTAIIGYGSLLEQLLPTDHPGQPYISAVLNASNNAANLVRRLLTFSRRQELDIRPVDLNEVINATNTLLLRLLDDSIERRIELSPEALPVLADRGQLEQVLMNLVANANDAMPSGGRVTISTEQVVLDREFEREHGFGKPGPYAVLSVTDTGSGMDEQTRQRIFEPFFTTKGTGQGTGLGLSIVYGIIKQHGGYITVNSVMKGGTTFRVFLPRAAGPAEAAAAVPRRSSCGGSETVLVAEDDRTIRNLICHVLETSGYCVIEALDGNDAIEKFAAHREAVNLLLLDVLMPGKNGRQVREEAMALRPDMKTLFLSGYTRDVIGEADMPECGYAFLGKPVTPDVLLEKVRELLDGCS